MKITPIGIDRAKNVFRLHGVDTQGKVVLREQLKRDKVLPFFANLAPCLVGMEACGSAHYWARKIGELGHTVKLMAVREALCQNKQARPEPAEGNNAADAEAICEAVTRPNMRCVPVKTAEQQAVLALHRARQGFVKARTAQVNQIRGLLGGRDAGPRFGAPARHCDDPGSAGDNVKRGCHEGIENRPPSSA